MKTNVTGSAPSISTFDCVYFKYSGLTPSQCDDPLIDEIAEENIHISFIFNGTNYVDFSYPVTWADEYKNEDEQWVPFENLQTLTKFHGSDKQCQETYQGVPGTWQGPWQ